MTVQRIALILMAAGYGNLSFAGALWMPEGVVSPDLGTATAGRAAAAQDASTAAGNPAGMTRLKQSELIAGFLGVGLVNRFDNDSAVTTTSGTEGHNNGDFIPALGTSFVYSFSDDLKFGFALGSSFGLGIDYTKSWPGRYFVTRAELTTVGANPSIGYRLNDWLSVGVGFDVLYAKLFQTSAINNLAGRPDGQIKLKDSDVGFGGNAGILIEPWEGTRFGLTYRSKIDLKFDDAVSFDGLGPVLGGLPAVHANLEMTIPQAVLLSVYHQLDDRLAIMANAGWQDWSEFGETNVKVVSPASHSFTQNRNFRDTWQVAIGSQYRFLPAWKASVGFAYDSSPVSDSNRTPDLAVDRQIRVGAGLQYALTQALTLGVAYEYMDAGNAPIDQTGGPLTGRLKGDYKDNHIHFFNLTADVKF